MARGAKLGRRLDGDEERQVLDLLHGLVHPLLQLGHSLQGLMYHNTI